MYDDQTGYDDFVTCECRYDAARDEMDRDDCPVHTDIDGERFTNGVCCRQWAEQGIHSRVCGNAPLETESDLERARRAA